MKLVFARVQVPVSIFFKLLSETILSGFFEILPLKLLCFMLSVTCEPNDDTVVIKTYGVVYHCL